MITALELMEDHAKALTEQRDALAAASKTWREAYERLDGEGTRQAMRIAALESALTDAIDAFYSWCGYASEYFADKHDLKGDEARMDKYRAELLGFTQETGAKPKVKCNACGSEEPDRNGYVNHRDWCPCFARNQGE